jgi:predicted nuclease of predicted toxin-antitoxin system
VKLLLDENLSHRLVPGLQAGYPGSSQVTLVGLSGFDDRAVWGYARAHDFVIVTKDDDFLDLSALYGPPPVVIRLVLGNCSNAQVLSALCGAGQASIIEAAGQGQIGVIELG